MISTQNSTTQDMLHEDRQSQALEEPTPDQALISKVHLYSEADLYYGKMQLEERMKYALSYDFTFESPLTYVRRFFESAFAPASLLEGASPVAHWKSFTERFIRNTTIFPMSQHFHPVYLAAGYLAVSRDYLLAQSGATDADKPMLPEFIAGYHWSLFVDPSIEQEQLNFVAKTLKEEYDFLDAMLTGKPLPHQTKAAQLQGDHNA